MEIHYPRRTRGWGYKQGDSGVYTIIYLDEFNKRRIIYGGVADGDANVAWFNPITLGTVPGMVSVDVMDPGIRLDGASMAEILLRYLHIRLISPAS